MKHHLWNMFISIKNAQMAKKGIIFISEKKICESFLKILWDEGFISGYSVMNNKIKVFLKYTKTGQPTINSLKFISKPGQRIYYSIKQIWKLDSSKLFIIFSTNKGLKSINQCKKHNLGGEPLLIIN